MSETKMMVYSAIEVLLEEGWISAATMGSTTLYSSRNQYRESGLPPNLDDQNQHEQPF